LQTVEVVNDVGWRRVEHAGEPGDGEDAAEHDVRCAQRGAEQERPVGQLIADGGAGPRERAQLPPAVFVLDVLGQ
jgi:hypothetical protein